MILLVGKPTLINNYSGGKKMKMCNNCGSHQADNAKFCSNCGSKIKASNVSASKAIGSNNIKSSETQIKGNQVNPKSDNLIDQSSTYGVRRLNEVGLDFADERPKYSWIISIFRYFIGSSFIVYGFINLSNQSGIMYILLGISIFPILYEILKGKSKDDEIKNVTINFFSVLLPIFILFIVINLSNVPGEELETIEIYGIKNEIAVGESIDVWTKTNIESYDTSLLLWSSSNDKVAKVENGNITGLSEGLTTITVASEEGVKQEFEIVVKVLPVEQIRIFGMNNVYIGSELKLSATITPVYAIDKVLEWQSSNPKIATVDQQGNIKTLSQGKVSIFATTSNGVTSTHILNVHKVVDSIAVSKTEMVLKVGTSSTLTLAILPNESRDAFAEWRTSNPKVATVENGKVTAVGPGKAIITASAGMKTTRTSITVKEKSPISIVNISYTKDSSGGIQWNLKFRNNTKKTINYITLLWDNYNAVGDLIYDEKTGKEYTRSKFTGPLKAGETSGVNRNTTLFYNPTFKSVVIKEIIIEYSDGTVDTFKTDQLTLFYDIFVDR
jgi:uncharacterized protein YjdB